MLPRVLSKYGLNEDMVVLPECNAAAREIQAGILVCDFEGEENCAKQER